MLYCLGMSASQVDPLSAEEHGALAAALFRRVAQLLDSPARSAEDDLDMLHAAHASRYHCSRAGGSPRNLARGEWQVSRVYAALGRWEPALVHGRLSLALAHEHELAASDLVYAHEALARAHLAAEHLGAARRHLVEARRALADVDDPADRAALEAELGQLEV
jgi:hypothetical protein